MVDEEQKDQVSAGRREGVLDAETVWGLSEILMRIIIYEATVLR